MDKVQIGEKIREARLAGKLTQEELAEKVDICVTYLSDIERGKKFPSFALFVKFAEALDVSADYLLRGEINSAKPHVYTELNRLLEPRTPRERQGAVEILKAYVKALQS